MKRMGTVTFLFWKMKDHLYHALDPRHLFPVDEALHNRIHRSTTIGPHPYKNGIDPLNEILLDNSYPLAPR
ncbi:MAG: hypothetical protein ACI9G1_000235 [Pirellulaceae bacterium]|jgi:hypothetical protein